jgi:hypothetical protein
LTEHGFTCVEAALGVRLPDAYRQLVVPYPIPAYGGNTDTELWDDPDALIELNRELRRGSLSIRPWPEHMFALGRDGGGCPTAIDIRDPLAPVWWADRCHLDAIGSGPDFASLAAWAEKHLAELRIALEEKGLGEDAAPSEREKDDAEGARAGCILLLAIAGGGALLVLAAWLIVFLLTP